MIANIESQRTEHQIPVAVSLRALDLSESWFYKHRNRPATPTRQRRDALDKAIVAAFEANDGSKRSVRLSHRRLSRQRPGALSG